MDLLSCMSEAPPKVVFGGGPSSKSVVEQRMQMPFEYFDIENDDRSSGVLC